MQPDLQFSNKAKEERWEGFAHYGDESDAIDKITRKGQYHDKNDFCVFHVQTYIHFKKKKKFNDHRWTLESCEILSRNK